MSQDFTTIPHSPEIRDKLYLRKNKGETYDDVVRRLLEEDDDG